MNIHDDDLHGHTEQYTIDTGILTKHIDTSFSSNVQTYANSLVQRLKASVVAFPQLPYFSLRTQTGDFSSQAKSFISCSSTTEPATKKRELKSEIMELIARGADATITPLECPLVWAKDANAFDCVSRASPLYPVRTSVNRCICASSPSFSISLQVKISARGRTLPARCLSCVPNTV